MIFIVLYMKRKKIFIECTENTGAPGLGVFRGTPFSMGVRLHN